MENIDEKIAKEKVHYQNLKNRTQIFGTALIILGIGFGFALAQVGGIAPIAGGLTAALYIAVGANILTRSINIKYEEEKSIRDIRMEEKIDKILSKLENNRDF